MTIGSSHAGASRLQVALAFAAVYVIWGSTYLAIRFAVDTLPPFLMMGTRFLLGGAFFYVWVRMSGEPIPTWRQVRSASIVGILMLCCATGVVGWAEQFVPSGLTALIISGAPAIFVLIEWLRPRGNKPNLLTIVGLVIGFTGTTILIGPDQILSGTVDHKYFIGAIAIMVASACWAGGSILSQHIEMPKSMLTAAAVELLVAGGVLVLFGPLIGERVVWETVSLKSVLALGYLTVFGALAFAAYVFLLRVSTPAKVSTYAYVNPIVAVILGTTLGGEKFDARMGIASVIIIGAVALITIAKSVRRDPEVSPTAAAVPVDSEV
ncbi:MAG: EamA family transporter [bacterium]|nr:EamA family transporter [bacterium]